MKSSRRFPGGLTNYNANDQIRTDTYDSNGNTIDSNGLGYVYDFENQVIQQGGITMAYDGDGNRNRVSKTANGVKTALRITLTNHTRSRAMQRCSTDSQK